MRNYGKPITQKNFFNGKKIISDFRSHFNLFPTQKNNKISFGVNHIAAALEYNKTLEVLCLEDNQITDICLEGFSSLRHNNTLSILRLKKNRITCNGMSKLASFLENNTGLKKLYLDENKGGLLGFTGIMKALEINSSFEMLSFAKNQPDAFPQTDSSMPIPKPKNIRSLRKLVLSNSCLSSTFMMDVVNLVQFCSTLTELSLQETKIGAFVPKLAEALQSNTVLISLGLIGNGLEDDQGELFANLLLVNNTLENLYLSSNKLGQKSGRALANALTVNTSLKLLYLSKNQLLDCSAIEISAALKVNQTLTSLQIGSNRFKDAGVEAICSALLTNTSLLNLKLSGNRIEKRARARIQQVLLENRTLEHLNISLKSEDIDDIVECLPNANIKILTLRNNSKTYSSVEKIFLGIRDNTTITELHLELHLLHINAKLQLKKVIASVFEVNFTLQLVTTAETYLRKFINTFLERNRQLLANRRFNTVKPAARDLDTRDIDSDEE